MGVPRMIRERGLKHDCIRCLDLNIWQPSPLARDGDFQGDTATDLD